MTDVRIYQPTKNAMQSGRFGKQYWVLEFQTSRCEHFEPLMHWISSDNTKEQLHLKFPTQLDAIMYAKKKNLSFEVHEPNLKIIKPKSYSDNFNKRRGILHLE